jgi:hypothetical protein
MTWRSLALNDKALIEEAFRQDPLPLSDYTFTNLWMWNAHRHYQIAQIDGLLCIKFVEEGNEIHLYPLGKGNRTSIIEKLKIRIMRAIPENHSLPFPLIPETSRFDYIYAYEELVHLPGNKYQPKRNLIHQFKNTYDYIYQEITSSLLPKVREMERKWFLEHREIEAEHQAILRLLDSFDQLESFGGVLIVQNEIVAYTFGEYLTEEMLVIHVEKACKNVKGAYQMINQQFLEHTSFVQYVNREEDLGIENLAKIKHSYHPIRLEKKFKLVL